MTIADDSLTQQMTAENTGDKAFDLTAALHTYFKVSDISKVGPHEAALATPAYFGQ